MNKSSLRAVAIVFAVLGMGIAMPSCPGQEAMQKQIDSLQSSQSESSRKMQTMDSQLRTLLTENNQMKQLLAQMTGAIQAQKGALDQLDAAMKAMQASTAKKGGGARRHR